MKRFVVVENPPKAHGARSVPQFRPVVFGGATGMAHTMKARSNRSKLSRSQIESLPARKCMLASRGRRFKHAPKCRTAPQKKANAAQIRARRLATLAQARAVRAAKRVTTGYGDAMGAYQTNRGRARRNAGRFIPTTLFNRGHTARRNMARFIPTTLFNRGGKRKKPRKARRNVARFIPTTLFNRDGRRRSRLRPLFVSRNFRSRIGSGTKSSRGRSAKNGGRTMATARQLAARRLFAARARAGTLTRKKGRHKARRNRRGVPLSGRTYRPSLPAKRRVMKVIKKFKKSWRAAHPKRRKAKRKAHKVARKRSHKRVARKARKNSIYTLYNKPKRRRKARRNRGRLSSNRARSLARRRWSGKARRNRKGGRRRARRNFGGGFLAKVKAAVSMQTIQSGLAVLAGAVAATGMPSLFGSWNQGWAGLGLSIAAAGLAGVAATYIAPKFLTEVASGGIVVVGLNLVARFAPQALAWTSVTGGPLVGKLGGYYGTGRGTIQQQGVAGFLPPVNRVAGFLSGGGGGRGLMAGSPEVFRAPKGGVISAM